MVYGNTGSVGWLHLLSQQAHFEVVLGRKDSSAKVHRFLACKTKLSGTTVGLNRGKAQCAVICLVLGQLYSIVAALVAALQYCASVGRKIWPSYDMPVGVAVVYNG